ncbi:MAG: hypothetical protein H0V66_12405 [Bdellovibrionales bacterium]|nr:hypothetical protein [Bdellovibrionales bacterium]
MKCLVIIALFLISFNSFATRDERQLIKCLGQEEKKLHLNKDTGPIYDLNQRLISEMIQIPHAELDVEFYNEMCAKSVASPALNLLELSIRMGKEIFMVPESIQGSQKEMAQGMIDDYIESTKDIFLKFLTQVQSLAPSPTCLKEEIPQIDAFFTDIKYLQEDVDMKKIFAGRDIKIFTKLLRYPQAFERCRLRIKKKLKSESKAAAKKS